MWVIIGCANDERGSWSNKIVARPIWGGFDHNNIIYISCTPIKDLQLFHVATLFPLLLERNVQSLNLEYPPPFYMYYTLLLAIMD